MTTYPLSTVAPTIDENGITAVSYDDILASLKASFLAIYPAANVDNDAKDGELLAVFAKAIYDCGQACVFVYNQFSPSTAVGAGLASVVKINGLIKGVSSNSTADLSIVGTAGTEIDDGVVQDESGYKWDLPSSVIIPDEGTITVTATCQTAGAISAAAGTITKIVTNTRGWQSVTNAAEATVGTDSETTATLRKRQAKSTALPSQSILVGIDAAVENITGVTAVKYYENDTDATDSNSIPPHSISFVVEGGDADSIASAIALKKGPGTGTYGTTSVETTDSNGVPVTIKFFRPTVVPITVEVDLTALDDYTTTVGTDIQASVADAINALGIHANGGLISLTALIAAVYSVSSNSTFNLTAIKIAKNGGTLTAADLSVAIYDLPTCSSSAVTLVIA